MKTFTFKIKVGSTKVVCAANMQLEQFFESVKMTDFNTLLDRYPEAYVTASDYFDGENYVDKDFALSTLGSLCEAKDLKSWLISPHFVGFLGDDTYSADLQQDIVNVADSFDKVGDENVGDDTSVEEQEVSA